MNKYSLLILTSLLPITCFASGQLAPDFGGMLEIILVVFLLLLINGLAMARLSRSASFFTTLVVTIALMIDVPGLIMALYTIPESIAGYQTHMYENSDMPDIQRQIAEEKDARISVILFHLAIAAVLAFMTWYFIKALIRINNARRNEPI